MAEFTLRAATPLNGIRRDYANLTIEEITDRALVSVMPRRNGFGELNDAINATFATALPKPGHVSSVDRNATHILGMGADQFFLLFAAPDGDPSISIRQSIGGAGYIVDQSDSWAMVRLTGPNCRAALERICSLDLDPGVFPPGRVARTVMEHLSVIILCETDTKYTLLSPRSSAGSFMHALDTSARNVE